MGSFLLRQCFKAVVRIFRISGEYAGTGCFVDSQGGILTTLYIAGKDKKFKVTLSDEQTFDAVLEKADGFSELALLRMHGDQPLHLQISKVEEIPGHEKVVIVGYAGNSLSTLEGTGACTVSTDSLSPEKIAIKVDSPPRGLSGAPALNEQGHVLGLLVGYLPETSRALSISGKSAIGFLQSP